MAVSMQQIEKDMAVEEIDEANPIANDDLSVLEFEVVDKFEIEPAFTEVNGGIYISRNEEIDYRSIEKHIVASGIRKKIAKKFVVKLGEDKGGFVSEIMGFKPYSPDNGGYELSEIDILFGKLYMPNLDGFETRFILEKTKTKKSDISIKIAGFGAGGSKEYICKITQGTTLSAIPVDLVIQATVKLIKWEHFLGDHFYTCHPINISRRIIGRPVSNPYEHEDGYDEIKNLSGIVDRYDTSILPENEEVTEELQEKTKINLHANLNVSPNLPIIKIDGTATVNSRINIIYSLPVGHKYATYVENENNFQHLWAREY